MSRHGTILLWWWWILSPREVTATQALTSSGSSLGLGIIDYGIYNATIRGTNGAAAAFRKPWYELRSGAAVLSKSQEGTGTTSAGSFGTTSRTTTTSTASALRSLLSNANPLEPPTQLSHSRDPRGIWHLLPRSKPNPQALFISGMAFLVGFMDVIYVRRYGCYVNMMTGNTIRAATQAAEGNLGSALFHVALVLCYCIGVGWHRRVANAVSSTNLGDTSTTNHPTLRRQRYTRTPHLYRSANARLVWAVAPVVWGLFAATDVVAYVLQQGVRRHHYPESAANSRWHGVFLATAFGLLNSTASHTTGGTILYAMTGHWTKLSQSIVDLWEAETLRRRHVRAIFSHVRVLAAFVSGIVLSVCLYEPFLAQLETGWWPVQTTVGSVYAGLLLWYGRRL